MEGKIFAVLRTLVLVSACCVASLLMWVVGLYLLIQVVRIANDGFELVSADHIQRLSVAENEIITLRAENRNLKKLLEECNAR